MDVPPWYLCIFLAFQHNLTAIGALVTIPLILSEGLCLQHDSLTQGRLINTIFLVSGLSTLLQITLGVRLPILQGGTFALMSPAMAFLSMPERQCPAWTQNATLVNASSPVFIDVWQSRMRTLQGAIMVASVLQIVVGFTGFIGFLMRFIGPLTIAPTVSLIGLSLYNSAGMKAGSHWGVSAMTVVLITLFSQYLRKVPVPIPVYSKAKKLHVTKFYMFQIMPILLGIGISWLVCYLLTIYDRLPADPERYGYLARTDVKGDVVGRAPWLTLAYPGQWGTPTVSLAAVLGMMAGIICSMLESVGDYHTCARLSGAPPLPKHAINRGIGIEGVCSLITGAFGTGNGTTSFSENVAAVGVTKVGSRMVIFVSGIIMILLGFLGKIGAVFTTIPTPVVGGMLIIMFGVITAAGISNLQSVDMNSSRNIFVFGFSMFSAIMIPNWMMKNPDFIDTGVVEVDQVLQVLLNTPMFIGGVLGFVLDNTIPGTKRERGLATGNKVEPDSSNILGTDEVYDLPFGISSRLSSYPWVRYVPFCPQRGRSSNKRAEGDASSQRSNQLPGNTELSVIINQVNL
ncbi:solute carrier family 23 member 1-like isoform X2 [Genypterus blacodes]